MFAKLDAQNKIMFLGKELGFQNTLKTATLMFPEASATLHKLPVSSGCEYQRKQTCQISLTSAQQVAIRRVNACIISR